MAVSAVEIVIATLGQHAPLAAMVEDRIYAVAPPQQAAPEQIVVNMASENEEELLAGASQYPETRVSIECRALKPSTAVLIGEAVKDALRDKHLHPIGGCLATIRKADTDVTSGSDEGSTSGFQEVSRRILDFYVRWRKAPAP